MTEFLVQMIEQYGYIALFFATAIDHTGTPGAMLVGISVAATGFLDIETVLLVSFAGGFIGDILAYAVGFYGGKRLITHYSNKNKSFENAIKKVAPWIDKHGNKTIVWGRFIALASRHISLVAGSFSYPFSKFIPFSLIGGALMVISFGIPAYFLGNKLNELTSDPLFSVYITVGIILAQIAGTWIWFRLKKTRQ